MKPNQKKLDGIWNNIKNRKYRDVAREFPETVIIAPEKLFSDPTEGDMMSVPKNNGTSRDYYQRRPGQNSWKQTWKQ
jgi:hypothetical protein